MSPTPSSEKSDRVVLDAVPRVGFYHQMQRHAAASCYAAEHDLMWKAWGLVGGLGRDEAKVRKLAEPEVRRQLVPIIREARDKDAQAAGHIERALARCTA